MSRKPAPTSANAGTSLRCAVYLRISSAQDDRPEDRNTAGLGRKVGEQLDLLKPFAESNGWTVIEPVYVDDGMSGSKVMSLAGWNRLVVDIKNGNVDVVLSRDSARLARNAQAKTQLMQLCAENNVQVWDYKSRKQVAYDKPIDKFQVGIQSLIDELYREIGREDMRRGLFLRALNGYPKHSRSRPFGYDKKWTQAGNDKPKLSLVINDEESKAVKKIFELWNNRVSLNAITRNLNQKNIKTVKGNYFTTRSVKRIITNPLYCGQSHYVDNPEYEDLWAEQSAAGRLQKPSQWTPIVSVDEWTKAQRHVIREPATLGRAPKYLLTGVLICHGIRKEDGSLCLKKMTGSPSKRGGIRYRCGEGCKNLTIEGKSVETIIIAATKARLAKLPTIVSNLPDNSTAIDKIDEEIRQMTEIQSDIDHPARLDYTTYGTIVNSLRDKRKALADESTSALPVIDQSKKFDDLDTDSQREIIKSIFGSIGVNPATKKGGRFDINRLVLPESFQSEKSQD